MIDLLVVGGGPVGLGTALLAHRAGLRVVVVERRDPPIDKACGEGLMPGALSALQALGADPRGRDFRGIRYVDGSTSVAAEFTSGPGRGVRRTQLHATLTAVVDAAGVEVRRVFVDGVDQSDSWVAAAGVRARYLAAADGLHSPVRRLLGLDRPVGTAARYGIRAHFDVAPWSDHVEVHWAAGREAYVTPVDENLVGVAILTGTRAPYVDQLAAFPALRERLPATPVTSVMGAGPLRQRSSARRLGRVLLVGDAAGYVDALTGEGIAVGLGAARRLVDCVLSDTPDRYERMWRATSRRYRWITQGLLVARHNRVLAPHIVPAAAKLPAVFGYAVNQLAR